MKQYAPWYFLILSLSILLSSCHKEEVTPNTRHVQVRISCTDVAGLGADYDVEFHAPGQPAQGSLRVVARSLTDGITMEELKPSQQGIKLKIFFNNVTSASSIRPTATMRMRGEIIVDDVVKGNVLLDGNSQINAASYLNNYVDVDDIAL